MTDVVPGTAVAVSPNYAEGASERFAADAAVVRYAVEVANELAVVDEESRDLALDLMRQLKAAIKEIEDQRLALVKPIKAVTGQIDAAARAARKPLEAAEQQLRANVNEFVGAQLAARRAAEEARRLADEEAGQISDPGTVDEVAQHVDRQVVTGSGTSVQVRERTMVRGDDLVAFVEWLTATPAKRKKQGWEKPTPADWALIDWNGHALRNQHAEGRQSFPPGVVVEASASVAVGA